MKTSIHKRTIWPGRHNDIIPFGFVSLFILLSFTSVTTVFLKRKETNHVVQIEPTKHGTDKVKKVDDMLGFLYV